MKPIQDLVDRFNEIAGRMADPKPDDDLDKLMDEMGRLQEQIDACGGWELDRMMDIACDALVLPPDDAPVAPAFRRRAAAGGPGHGPAGKARPAAAGRADQPSRRRNDPVARTDAPRVSRHGDHRHPRPLLPRQHHQVDSGARERPRPAVRGQLLLVARAEGPTAADHREAGNAAAKNPRARIGVDPQVAPRAACRRTRPA